MLFIIKNGVCMCNKSDNVHVEYDKTIAEYLIFMFMFAQRHHKERKGS